MAGTTPGRHRTGRRANSRATRRSDRIRDPRQACSTHPSPTQGRGACHCQPWSTKLAPRVGPPNTTADRVLLDIIADDRTRRPPGVRTGASNRPPIACEARVRPAAPAGQSRPPPLRRRSLTAVCRRQALRRRLGCLTAPSVCLDPPRFTRRPPIAALGLPCTPLHAVDRSEGTRRSGWTSAVRFHRPTARRPSEYLLATPNRSRIDLA